MSKVPAALALALALASLLPGAAAQILVDPIVDAGVVEAGTSATLTFDLENPTDRAYVVVADVGRGAGVAGVVEPSRVRLEAQTNRSLALVLEVAEDAPAGAQTLDLRLRLVDTAAGETRDIEAGVALTVRAQARILGLFAPPPAPLDRAGGLFLVEAALWLAAALAVGFAAWRRGGLGTPLALFVLALGLRFSARLLQPHPGADLLERVLALAAVLAGALLVKRALTAGIRAYGRRVSQGRNILPPTMLPVLDNALAVAITGFALALALQVLGLDIGFLLAGGVVVGLVLSLAAQDTLSNLFSGFFILIDRPFREGDEIRLDTGEICRVDKIGLRTTRLYHFKHEQLIVVPNNDVAAKRVTNLSYPDATYRLLLRVDVAYSTSLPQAVEILQRVARETPDVMTGPGRDPVVWLREFGESGIELQLRVYVPTSRHRNPVRTALILGIKGAFDAAAIEIPAPQRVVRLLGADATGGLHAEGPGPREPSEEDTQQRGARTRGG